ncbi:MAG: metallophosphoesterase [Sphaerochaetaceae bacterium]|nr:metallophosphoesterase [Sphaerochaetaceae bacterium]
MKKVIIALFLGVLSFALTSCNPDPGGRDLDLWDESSSLYQINYDKSTGQFSSDYSNVAFIEMTGDEFKVLNLTDIQIDNNSLLEINPKVMVFQQTLDELINDVSPDLITVTGDFGDYGNCSASLVYISRILDSRNIPFAVVFGNHDNEGNVIYSKASYLEGLSRSLFRAGPSNLAQIEESGDKTELPALGNYVVNVVKKDDSPEGFHLVRSFVFMNTGRDRFFTEEELLADHAGERRFNTGSWGSLSAKQIEWYKWAINSAKAYNSLVPSSLFVHIPIFEYVRAIGSAVKGAPDIYDFTNFYTYCRTISYEQSLTEEVWNEGFRDSFGVFHDSDLGCSDYDDFVFMAIKDLNLTDSVICGHDHTNNMVVNYQNVLLAYGTKTGIGSYHEDGINGGTAIIFGEGKPTIQHYL